MGRAASLDPRGKVNLGAARVLLLDDNTRSLRILSSALTGFGVRTTHRCTTAAEAQRVLASHVIDLIIADCDLAETDGFDFVHWLRRSGIEENAFTPVVMVTGHTELFKVRKARDCGANFIVAKPVTPSVLLERIVWVARDPRPFVEAGQYMGPDRRHKEVAPPKGARDRRTKKAKAAAADAALIEKAA